MAVKFTTGPGDVENGALWNGGTVPAVGDAVTLEHAMTVAGPLAWGGGSFLSLNLLGAGGGGLTVTGAVTIEATTITGFEKLVDTAATDLVITGNCSTSATAGWTCNSAAANPTQIIGNLTCGGAACAAHALDIKAACKLIVTGNVSGTVATGFYGVLVRAGSTLQATGNVAGISANGAADSGVYLLDATSVITAASVTGLVTGAGKGIDCLGTITAVCTGTCGAGAGVGINVQATGHIIGACLGTASGAGTGIASEHSIVGDIVGVGGLNGIGVQLGVSNATLIVGNVTGTCAVATAYLAGYGIRFNSFGAILGGLKLTSNPTSGWIYVRLNSFKILATAGNTIQFGDATPYCPVANVVDPAYVKVGQVNYTGGAAGTATLAAMGPYPVGSVAIGPYPVGAASVGPYPVV